MSDILVSRDGSVLQLELNRPAKKNAITAAMYEALISAFKEAAADPDVRVVLICGAGSGCAGLAETVRLLGSSR